MLIRLWITFFLISIPLLYRRTKRAEKAHLWIKYAQKRGLSTTFPQNVDTWIVTMWKSQYLVKKNFEIQYIEVQKSFFYKARRASRRAACGLPFGSIYLSARVCISCFRGDFPLKQRVFNNFYLTCQMKIYIIRMLFTTQSSRMARRRNCL